MKHSMSAILISMILATMAACVPAPDTTFVVQNVGDQDLFHSGFGWLTLQVDGERASFREPGCMAECGAITQTITCADRIAVVNRLEPGEEREFNWDGVYYVVDDERNCYRPRRRKAEFAAEFCYGHDYEMHGDAEDVEGKPQRIENASVPAPICEEVAFERGELVEIPAE